MRASLKMGAPYASLIAEFGILGSLAFVAFVALLVRRLLDRARSGVSSVSRALATAAIFMILNMVIESVVHPTFRDSFISFFVFGAAGASLALTARGDDDDGAWDPRLISTTARIALAGAGLAVIGLTSVVLGLLPLRA